MEKDNGGPAFPGQVQTSVQTVAGIHGYGASHDVPDRTFPVYSPTPGMTLRDWFAGNASADDVMRHRFENPDGTERDPILTVERAKWEYADEMLAERNRKE